MINIQNFDDSECFKWYLVRYLHSVGHNLKRITKSDNDFTKNLDYNDIKFPVKVRDILTMKKKNSIWISAFGYENKEKHPKYVSK